MRIYTYCPNCRKKVRIDTVELDFSADILLLVIGFVIGYLIGVFL